MNKRQYLCPHPNCANKYASKNNVRRHIKFAHPDYHQFQCDQCGKVLSSQQNYRQHLHIHTGAKPFLCPFCGLCFRQGSQLSIHKHSHMPHAQPAMSIPQLSYLLLVCACEEDREMEAASVQREYLPAITEKQEVEPESVTLPKFLW